MPFHHIGASVKARASLAVGAFHDKLVKERIGSEIHVLFQMWMFPLKFFNERKTKKKL